MIQSNENLKYKFGCVKTNESTSEILSKQKKQGK